MAKKKSDADELPAKKKKADKPKKGGSPVLLIAIAVGAVGVLLLCIAASVGGYFMFRKPATDDVKKGGDVAKKKGEVKPPIELKLGLSDPTAKLAISPDGKFAMVHGWDGKTHVVQVWNLTDKKKLYEYRVSNPSSLALSPDGKWAAYFDNTPNYASLIDMATGKEIHKLRKKKADGGFSGSMHFSPKSDLVVASIGNDIVGWDMSGSERFAWKNDAQVNCLSPFFDGGKKIASGDRNNAVKIWDVDQGKPVNSLAGAGGLRNNSVKSIAISGDGKSLVSTTTLDSSFRIWDMGAGGGKLQKFPELPGTWGSPLLTPDGNTLIYHTSKNDILLLDPQTAAKNYELKGHTKEITALALTEDGATLVSVSRDDTLKIWDIKDLK